MCCFVTYTHPLNVLWCYDLEVDMVVTERKRLKLKGCPRCKGDLLIDKAYNEYPVEVCIQCGFHHYLEVEGKELSVEPKEPVLSIH